MPRSSSGTGNARIHRKRLVLPAWSSVADDPGYESDLEHWHVGLAAHWSAERNRRLSGELKLSVEARAFRATDRDDPLYWFRRDHYAQVAIRYFY